MIKTYKCLSCGASLKFDPNSQKFKCEYCDSVFEVSELKNEEVFSEQVNVYNCKSCGAEVITEEDTTASFCFYCHNPVIITSRLRGDFKPDFVLPFQIDKRTAIERFKTWASRNKFIPASFLSASSMEKITGMYLPYWSVKAESKCHLKGKGENRKVWRTGDKEHTKVDTHSFNKQFDQDIKGIYLIAYETIREKLIGSVYPYNLEELKPFSPSYLSGFFAHKYQKTKDDLKESLDSYVSKTAIQGANNAIGNLSNIEYDINDIEINIKDYYYILLPIWILTFNYYNKTYVYAINAQTNKAFGELPLDKRRLRKYAFGISAVIFIILMLGGLFVW